MSHCLSKTMQTECTSWFGKHCYWSGGLCNSGSQKSVGTTDVSPPVKNNTDRMNQLVGEMFLPGWRSCDGGSQTRLMTTDVSPTVKNNTDRMN